MQSDGNSLGGDDSFDMSYWDEDGFLDQSMRTNIVGSLLGRFEILEVIKENAYLLKNTHTSKEIIK